MWRDRWFALAVVGAVLSCLACATPLVVVWLGALGLGAWTGRLDLVLPAALLAFVVFAAYRIRVASRRTS
jgi:mercuric ion transport protein